MYQDYLLVMSNPYVKIGYINNVYIINYTQTGNYKSFTAVTT